MEVTDTIYKIGDSINVVTHHIANESHDLTGYMKDSIEIFPLFGNTDWNVVSNLGFVSGIIASAILVVIFLWIIAGPKVNDLGKIVTSKRFFLFVWLYGFVVYDVGMCTGEYISLLTNAPMAVLYAFKIFLFDSDVSEIHDAFHESWVYSFNFALVHFLAAFISTVFLIKLFGFTIMQRVKMYYLASRFGKQVSETYVFWGFNEATDHLIESIRKQYKDSSDYRVIIIRTNKDKNDLSENSSGIARIFDFLSLPSSELSRLQNLGSLTDGTHTNLSTINTKDENVDIIGTVLKMKSLKKILSRKTTNKIHMLFLSDNEKDNLHDVSIFRNDTTIKEFVGQDDVNNQRQVLFYCHARYNSVHRVIEDRYAADGIIVKVVDSSHINVEMLKHNKDVLPANFVDVQDDATVSSAFNALVVGFSEVGQDSVRFLYESGAFVKSGSNDRHVARSDFHLHVVDKNMADLAGIFVANAPAIKLSMPFIKGLENPDALITLHEMDCRSVEFYLQLEKWIKDLNYIVVATDNDELNISLGVRIFKIATRYRKDLDKFCILVRVHNDDDGQIRKIAEHYNRLWAAQIAAGSYTAFHQKMVERDALVKTPIYLFGLDKETYTYENVLADTLEKKAIEFKEVYEASSNPTRHKYAIKELETAWYRDYVDKMQLDGEYSPYCPTYGALMRLRRTQGQDFANCFHSETKRLLSEKALAQLGIPLFSWEKLSRKADTVFYTLESGETINPCIIRILNVLAQTEHLRWNASHEILGYRYVGEPKDKDEVRLHHGCITDWENLDEKTQSHDYNVVDVTLNIINPERPIKL